MEFLTASFVLLLATILALAASSAMLQALLFVMNRPRLAHQRRVEPMAQSTAPERANRRRN